MEQHKADQIEYKSKDGITFHIRAQATRGDQYAMHSAMADESEVSNGVVIKANASILFPWLIKRFVTGWSHSSAWSYDMLENLPADGDEDLIMVLGSYILNHVKGLTAKKEDESKKKG